MNRAMRYARTELGHCQIHIMPYPEVKLAIQDMTAGNPSAAAHR